MANLGLLRKALEARGIILKDAPKGSKTTIKRDPRSIDTGTKLVPASPTKVAIDPGRIEADPEGVAAAIEAANRQINVIDDMTKGTFGKTDFKSLDPTLNNAELLSRIGQPQLPLFPSTSPTTRTVNPTTSAPSTSIEFQRLNQNLHPDAGRSVAERPLYTPPPREQPVVDRLNAIRDPSVIPTRNDPFPKEIQSNTSKTKLPFRQSGRPKTNKQLDADERFSRTGVAQGETVRDTQTGLSSGSEEAITGSTLKEKVANSIKEFRGNRPRSPTTDRFAIDQRVLANKTGITQRLKAYMAQQFTRFDPTTQHNRLSVGDDFDKLNKSLQDNYTKSANIARNDPATQKAVDALNLDVNKIARDSIAIEVYNKRNPGVLPQDVRQDIKFFERLRNRAEGPTRFNPETGTSRPVPEIIDEFEGSRKSFRDRSSGEDSLSEIQKDQAEAKASELTDVFRDVQKRTNVNTKFREKPTDAPELTNEQVPVTGTGRVKESAGGKESFPTVEEAAEELGLTIEQAKEILGGRPIPAPPPKGSDFKDAAQEPIVSRLDRLKKNKGKVESQADSLVGKKNADKPKFKAGSSLLFQSGEAPDPGFQKRIRESIERTGPEDLKQWRLDTKKQLKDPEEIAETPGGQDWLEKQLNLIEKRLKEIRKIDAGNKLGKK